jgi:DNA-binding transcriptional LysR family regulator
MRAAEKCGVRQPSVSKAIRRLEALLGGELFVRGRPVQLSKLGTALLPIFARINELAGKAQKIAGDHSRRRLQGKATLQQRMRWRQREVLTGAAHRGQEMFQVSARRHR